MAKRENYTKLNSLNKRLFIVLVVALVFIAVYRSPFIIKSQIDPSRLEGVLATEGELMPECTLHTDCGATNTGGVLTFPNCKKCVDNKCVSAAGSICADAVTNLRCNENTLEEVYIIF
jgi:hypothetical protein